MDYNLENKNQLINKTNYNTKYVTNTLSKKIS